MKLSHSKSKTNPKRKQKEEANSAPKLSRMQDATDTVWSEVYHTDNYCMTEVGDEIYAKASNQVEMFNPKPPAVRYARKKRKASNGEDEELEYPPKDKNKPSFLSSLPLNLRTGLPIEPEYEINPDTNIPDYPKDEDGNEYYYKNVTGDDFVISYEDGSHTLVYKYAKTNRGREIYPKRKDEEYVWNNYARDESNEEFYPKDKEGNEVLFHGKYAMRKGDEVYPKDKDGGESYLRIGSEEIPAKLERDTTAQEYYAKNAVGGEFYPKIYMNEEAQLDEYVNEIRRVIESKIATNE